MTTALSGTTTERKTAISNRKEAPSTAAKNTAVRDFKKSLTSALTTSVSTPKAWHSASVRCAPASLWA